MPGTKQAVASPSHSMGDEHFAFVFGLNTLAALALFAVIQAIISSLGLDIQARFWVYTVRPPALAHALAWATEARASLTSHMADDGRRRGRRSPAHRASSVR